MKEEREQTFASGKLSRALKTSAIATKVGIKHLGYVGKKSVSRHNSEKTKEDHEATIGKIIFDGLSQLKGTALKASQLLSLEADLLPEGIRKELAKGCYNVPPINRAHIRKVFLSEFGQTASELFKEFESTAFAAASLGQVHRATSINGEKLAVKVQYPSIAQSIESDMKLLSTILKGLEATTSYLPNKNVIDTALDEISLCLKQEVDYEKEKDNSQWFQTHLTIDGVTIPRVYDDYSTKKIITFEFLEGQHIDQWLKTNPSQELRNIVGERIFTIFLKSAFELKVLHSDPHLGNYLVLNDNTLALLDFGCVKKLDDSFPKDILSLIYGILSDDPEKTLAAYQTLKVIAPDVSLEEYLEQALPYLKDIQQWFVAPFKNTSYDFSELPTPPTLKPEEHKEAIKYLNQVRQDQLYFDRTYFGVYKLLKKLEANISCRSLLEQYTE